MNVYAKASLAQSIVKRGATNSLATNNYLTRPQKFYNKQFNYFEIIEVGGKFLVYLCGENRILSDI